MSQFLALFERTLTGIESTAERFLRELDPAAASAEIIDWLAGLVDLAFDPSWDLGKRRALVGEAMELWKRRGTPDGLARYIEIYTGIRPLIVEAYRERPERPIAGGGIVGQSLVLGVDSEPSLPGDEALISAYAHRFTVVLPLADPCDAERMLPVVERIIALNKPAHTAHGLRTVAAGGRLELESTVGVDLVLGGEEPHVTHLADSSRGETGSILGSDAVLGAIRPLARPPDPVL